MKVFAICIDWNMGGDAGNEILAICKEETLKEKFAEIVEKEKADSWLNDYFENGKFNEDSLGEDETLTNYESDDTFFEVNLNDGDWYTTIWAKEFEV